MTITNIIREMENKLKQKLAKVLQKDDLLILELIYTSFPKRHKKQFIQQLRSIGVARREIDGKTVNFYSRGFLSGKPLRCTPFDDFPTEIIAAEFRTGRGRPIEAAFWYVNGVPFCIEYQQFADRRNLKNLECVFNSDFLSLLEKSPNV